MAPFPERKSRCRIVNNLPKDKQRVSDLSDFNPRSVPLHRLCPSGWDSGRESAQRKAGLLTSMQRKTETKLRLRRVRRKGVGPEIICHPATLEELMLPPGPRSQACPAPPRHLAVGPSGNPVNTSTNTPRVVASYRKQADVHSHCPVW